MRQETIVRNIYKYEELSEAAKKSAKERYNELDIDLVTELLIDIVEEAGFKGADVYWSLSYCQGDGACFVGRGWRGEELEKIVTKAYKGEVPKNIKRILPFVNEYIVTHSGRYYHYNSCRGEIYFEREVTRAEKYVEELEEVLEEYRKEVCQRLEDSGYKNIEYFMSEEYFAELCELNEWEFTEEGVMI